MKHLVFDRGAQAYAIYEDELGFVLHWINSKEVANKLEALGTKPTYKTRIDNSDYNHLSILPDTEEIEALIDEGRL